MCVAELPSHTVGLLPEKGGTYFTDLRTGTKLDSAIRTGRFRPFHRPGGDAGGPGVRENLMISSTTRAGCSS